MEHACLPEQVELELTVLHQLKTIANFSWVHIYQLWYTSMSGRNKQL